MQLLHQAVGAVVLALLTGVTALAQPQQQHLVQAGNLRYLGKFSLPPDDGTGRSTAEGSLGWGGAAIGVGPDGQSLYFGCHDWGNRLARVTIPAIGGRGSVVEPCAPIANLGAINAGTNRLGGSLWWNGRLTVSAYSYYDGNGTSSASHFVGTNVANQAGPHRIGSQNPGFVGGYMGVVPQEWRGLLGGPALTGQCCLSILSRTSYGPSVSVFDPDQLGAVSPVPSTMLVGYPDAHQTFGPWNVYNPYFTGATTINGVAFPAGTRSVLFIGRHGTTFCYGTGTSNPALNGTPDGQGNPYCYDPTGSAKGTHGFPYKHQVWAYDANDLLAVKQGIKSPWDVLPYAVWNLGEMDLNSGFATMRSAVYDPATRRWYVVVDYGDSTPEVHVYEVTNAVLQVPSPGPLGLATQATAAGNSLVWFPPLAAGLTGYRLDVGSSPGALDVASLPLAASARSLPLPAGVSGTFFVRLVALYADGTSGASQELRLVLGSSGAIPGAPANVRGSVSVGALTLNWDPPADAAVSTIVIDVGSVPQGTDVTVGMPLGKYGPYVVPNPPNGTFYIRFRAVSAAGTSGPSNELVVVVGSAGGGDATSVPRPPSDIRASVNSSRVVTLNWEPGETGPAASGFTLDAGSAPGLSDIGSYSVSTATLTAGPAPPGVYYLRVRAWNAAGSSTPGPEYRLIVR